MLFKLAKSEFLYKSEEYLTDANHFILREFAHESWRKREAEQELREKALFGSGCEMDPYNKSMTEVRFVLSIEEFGQNSSDHLAFFVFEHPFDHKKYAIIGLYDVFRFAEKVRKIRTKAKIYVVLFGSIWYLTVFDPEAQEFISLHSRIIGDGNETSYLFDYYAKFEFMEEDEHAKS